MSMSNPWQDHLQNALAAEVTLLKYDTEKKELTVKDGDAEKTYKLTDKTKVAFVDKDGNKKDGNKKEGETKGKNASEAKPSDSPKKSTDSGDQ